MRVPLIAGNWKMNTTVAEAAALVKAMRPGLDAIDNVEKVICPPFVSLATVRQLLEGSSVQVGAQNLFYEDKGAFTGEISPLMVAELCRFVIIGHSERRQYFGESGELIKKKVMAALKVGLKPILCVGERLEENEAGKTDSVITAQLTSALSGIKEAIGLSVAYEPVWAIGTGKAATGEQANATIAMIRRTVSGLLGGQFAGNMRILYGGSVTAANIAEFIRQPDIDGALVGGASLKANEFISIAQQAAGIKRRA